MPNGPYAIRDLSHHCISVLLQPGDLSCPSTYEIIFSSDECQGRLWQLEGTIEVSEMEPCMSFPWIRIAVCHESNLIIANPWWLRLL